MMGWAYLRRWPNWKGWLLAPPMRSMVVPQSCQFPFGITLPLTCPTPTTILKFQHRQEESVT